MCADFAEMLHNNAEAAGWRAAYVLIRLGPSKSWPTQGGHTLNAFQTPDRGLVYIDATGTLSGTGPRHGESTVALATGQEYVPESIFPEEGWHSTWESMGKVLAIESVQW